MAQTQTPTLVVNDGEEIPYIPAAQVYGGDVVVQGAMVGVAMSDIAANTLGALKVAGRVKAPKDASTFSAGDTVYWNATGNPTGGTAGTGCATSTAGDTVMGQAVSAQVTGDATVNVILGKGTIGSFQRMFAEGVNASDTVTNTSAETAFATTAVIPAGTLQAGDVVRARIGFEVTAQNSTNTHNVKLKISTAANTFTTVLSTAATNAAANTVGYIEADLMFTAVGASGAFNAIGLEGFGAAPVPAVLGNTNCNTSLAITVEATSTASAASAGNVIQLLELDVVQRRK